MAVGRSVQPNGRYTPPKLIGEKSLARQEAVNNMRMGLGARNLGTSPYARMKQDRAISSAEHARLFDERIARRQALAPNRQAGIDLANERRRMLKKEANAPARTAKLDRAKEVSRQYKNRHPVAVPRMGEMGGEVASEMSPRRLQALRNMAMHGSGQEQETAIRMLAGHGVNPTKPIVGGMTHAQPAVVRGSLPGRRLALPSGAPRSTAGVPIPKTGGAIDLSKYALHESELKAVPKEKGIVAKGMEAFGRMSAPTKIGVGLAAAVAAGVVMNRRDKGVRPAGPGRY